MIMITMKGKRSIAYYGVIHIMLFLMSGIRAINYIMHIINKETFTLSVISSCSATPLLIVASISHLYGIIKILNSKYYVRRLFSNSGALIIVLLNLLNISTVIVIITNTSDDTVAMAMLLICNVSQIILGFIVCLPCGYIFYLFRKRTIEKYDILDADYLTKLEKDVQTKAPLSRIISFMDTFKIDVKNETKIPFFVKAIFVQCFIISSFIVVRMVFIYYLIMSLNHGITHYRSIMLNIVQCRSVIETSYAALLLSFSIHCLYAKRRSDKTNKYNHPCDDLKSSIFKFEEIFRA
ncbi:hypothetical protein A3Q56_03998 [Intoshia linei]|uniref:G-protein coupled receptors family 1 profile domain-containing protein n=1 Tax=Intoshia linei TaxID=1819745 RepID=A0A177B200_9BILA|nr:hypothetical protein A3Q56_03998 [Intoshia linei]